MVEGSGVSRDQLLTFGDRAISASSDMSGTINNLMNRLSALPDISRGDWIVKFQQVQQDVNRNMTLMTQALEATGSDAKVAAGGFSEGDQSQSQQQANVQDAAAGIKVDSFRV